jgi:hypothetical protein
VEACRGSGSVHGRLCLKWPRPRSWRRSPPLQLDLQGRHPGPRRPLVREERHGDGAVPLRRVREGLALDRRRNRATGTRASPISMAIARSSSGKSATQVAGDPRAARDDPVPRLLTAGARHPSSRSWQPDHGAGGPWECWNPLASITRRRPFDDGRAPCAEPGARPLSGGGALARLTSSARVSGVRGMGTRSRTSPDESRRWRATGATSRRRARRRGGSARGGCADGFGFTFKNRGIPNPTRRSGIGSRQWRQIGLNVKIETLELGDTLQRTSARAGSRSPRFPLHLHLPVAPHRPAQRRVRGLDDHAEPLPEQSARHGSGSRSKRAKRGAPSTLALREASGRLYRAEGAGRSDHRQPRRFGHHALYLLPGGSFRVPSPRRSGEEKHDLRTRIPAPRPWHADAFTSRVGTFGEHQHFLQGGTK